MERLAVVVAIIMPELGAIVGVASLKVDRYLVATRLNIIVSLAARLPLAILLTGIAYFEAFVLSSLFYQGFANVGWFIGIPATVAALTCRGNKLRACVLFPLIIVPGLIVQGLLQEITNIQLLH